MRVCREKGIRTCFLLMLRFNDDNEVLREDEYRAIIVGLDTGGGSHGAYPGGPGDSDMDSSMDELEALAEADGVQVLGRIIQRAERPNPATCIGRGKVEELRELCRVMEADTVIFNDELSGMQLRNLEEALDVRVIDRTMLILDIFADRAISREGKLQVELAQLQYRLPRLTGFGRSLSRLGGGIGTRGPGEKKLETDRRHISARIDDIRRQLKRIAATREVQRSERKRSGLPTVALMGYTNAGKSAIMNHILRATEREEKTVESRDMLFATLDPAHRRVLSPGGREFLLIDTVGFVSRLPHGLVRAFRSTLEEVADADLLIHVVDSARGDREFQIEVAEKVMDEICGTSVPRLMVYNKIDLVDELPLDLSTNDAVCVSAKTGENMEALLGKIDDRLGEDMVSVAFAIPYDRGQILSRLCETGQVEEMIHGAEGTVVLGRFSAEDRGRYAGYEISRAEAERLREE